MSEIWTLPEACTSFVQFHTGDWIIKEHFNVLRLKIWIVIESFCDALAIPIPLHATWDKVS